MRPDQVHVFILRIRRLHEHVLHKLQLRHRITLRRYR